MVEEPLADRVDIARRPDGDAAGERIDRAPNLQGDHQRQSQLGAQRRLRRYAQARGIYVLSAAPVMGTGGGGDGCLGHAIGLDARGCIAAGDRAIPCRRGAPTASPAIRARLGASTGPTSALIGFGNLGRAISSPLLMPFGVRPHRRLRSLALGRLSSPVSGRGAACPARRGAGFGSRCSVHSRGRQQSENEGFLDRAQTGEDHTRRVASSLSARAEVAGLRRFRSNSPMSGALPGSRSTCYPEEPVAAGRRRCGPSRNTCC